MDFLRLLFWLKWTLTRRGYRRSRSAVVGLVLALVVFLPVSLGIAAACALGYLHLPPPYNSHLLRAVLLGIYLFWLLAPLLGYALNDTYDITKLFLFPVSPRQIFVGAILGSVVDFPVLLLLPALLATLIGFGGGVLPALFALAALALFLFHTLSLSQAVVLATAGVLRSRRFRDIVVVLVPLFWMSYYILSRMAARQIIRLNWGAFLSGPVWDAISFLPSGLAARAMTAAARGDFLPAAGFLLALALVTAATVYLAGWMIEKVYAGEVAGPRIRKRAAPPAPPRTPTPERTQAAVPERAPGLRLPPVIDAVIDKELKYLVRDPYFKIALMNLVYLLFVVGFAFLSGRRGTGVAAMGPGVIWGGTGWILFSECNLLFNVFGTDGAAAASLFLFPSSRREILIGKNLTLFTALSGINLVFLLVLSGLAGALSQFGVLFCWMELALAVCCGVGNLVSVWFPHRIVARGWRMRQQVAGRGCGYGFLYLGVSLGAFLLLAPILAALLLPTFWVPPVWYALGVPLALLYAAGLYLLSLRLAEPLLLRREVEVVHRLAAGE